MSFYRQTVAAMNEQVYPKTHLTRQVLDAKHYIDTHYDRHIDLDMISRAGCFSRFHFIRVFKCYYGTTPNQYLTDVRIARAKELLVQGKTALEACSMVGFESYATFSALFKRMTGIRPALIAKKQF